MIEIGGKTGPLPINDRAAARARGEGGCVWDEYHEGSLEAELLAKNYCSTRVRGY